MKLRNANGGFISPASQRRRGPGHCIRAAKGETVGVPRVKELQQRARKVNSKTRGFSSRAASSSASRSYCTLHGRIAEPSGTLFTGLSWEAYCVEAVKYSLSNSLADFHAASL